MCPDKENFVTKTKVLSFSACFKKKKEKKEKCYKISTDHCTKTKQNKKKQQPTKRTGFCFYCLTLAQTYVTNVHLMTYNNHCEVISL